MMQAVSSRIVACLLHEEEQASAVRELRAERHAFEAAQRDG